MPSGGARARSGPPPQQDALRRDRDKAEWIRLPAGGREGDAPAWPLSSAKPRERVLWATEWRRPQALMWESDGQVLEVALYVRAVVVAEGRKATAADRNVVLRHMDGLGLTQGGLARNRWLIEAERAEAPTTARTDDSSDRTSAKARLRAIAGGAA